MRTGQVTTALALLALAVAPAFAQPGPSPPGPPGGPGPGHLGFVLRALDLTEEQQVEVDALLATRRQLDEADRPAVEAARRALGEQIRAASFDESAIRARAAAVAVHEADRLVADAALLRDVRALLTDVQRETFERLLTPPEPAPGGPGPMDRRGPRERRSSPREGRAAHGGPPASPASRRAETSGGPAPERSSRRSPSIHATATPSSAFRKAANCPITGGGRAIFVAASTPDRRKPFVPAVKGVPTPSPPGRRRLAGPAMPTRGRTR